MNTVGLLDPSGWSWLEFQTFNEKASFIQKHIYELLKKVGASFSQVEKIIYAAGPGSYTGMRITEGIANLAQVLKIEACGFYHYEIPRLKGETHYIWLSNAFKKEFFVYEENHDKRLLTEEELKEFLGKNTESLWTYHGSDYFNQVTQSTQKEIFGNPQLLKTVEGLKKPYYYRPINIEFSRKQS